MSAAPWMRLADLTGQSRVVALLVASGWTYDEIGQEICVTRQTVKGHVYILAHDLGITGRSPVRMALALWVWQQQPAGIAAHMRRRESSRGYTGYAA